MSEVVLGVWRAQSVFAVSAEVGRTASGEVAGLRATENCIAYMLRHSRVGHWAKLEPDHQVDVSAWLTPNKSSVNVEDLRSGLVMLR
jgi:hypothetical protein